MLPRNPPIRHVLGGERVFECVLQAWVGDDVVTEAVQKVHSL